MSAKKEVQTRMIWSYQETEDLIDIIHAKFITRLLLNKKCRKWPIFEEIRTEMERYGHDKTTKQIIFKYKNLCAMYRTGKQIGKQIGGKPMDKDRRFEFYDKMCELFQNATITNDDIERGCNDATMTGDVDDDEFESQRDEKEKDSRSTAAIIGGGNSSTIGIGCNKRYLKQENDDDYDDDDPLGEDELMERHQAKRSKIETNKEDESNDYIIDDIDQDNITEEFILENSDDKPDNTIRKTITEVYKKQINHLVKCFKVAQNDLQNKFYTQQLKLQQQQQQWEERMLDEEREFFSKILKSNTNTKDFDG